MPTPKTNEEMDEIKAQLEVVKLTQEAFWDALYDLEQLTERSLDSTIHFDGYRAEDILEGLADSGEDE